MARAGTKETAEAVLRELPSVLGASVREDARGNPREVHLLVSAGPSPGDFARDVRDLLEEHLGVAVDQRVISVAQLDRAATWPEPEPPGRGGIPHAALMSEAPSGGEARARLDTLSTRLGDGRVSVHVRLGWEGALHDGEAEELEVGLGACRAAARAALAAAEAACGGAVRFGLDTVAPLRAFERDYVLVTATAAAPALGRRPLALAGAQPVEVDGEEWAAGLAALKAVNRILGRALTDPRD